MATSAPEMSGTVVHERLPGAPGVKGAAALMTVQLSPLLAEYSILTVVGAETSVSVQAMLKLVASGTSAPVAGAVIVTTGATLSITTRRLTPATYAAGLPVINRLWLPARSVLRTANR